MRTPAVVLALAVAGCGGGDSPSPRTAGLDGPDTTVRLHSEDVYRVGVLDGDSWDVFARVTSVAFDRSGNLYILDSDAGHIAVVDTAGQLIRTVGKPGGGPGELQAPFGFAPLPDGRLAVFDLGKQGFQIFDEQGAFLESVSVDLAQGSPGQRIAVRPDGRLVSAGGFRMTSGGPPSEEVPEGRPVHLFSVDGAEREVLYNGWAPPPPETEMSETLEGGPGESMSFTMRTQAFEPGLHFAVVPSGQVAVVDSTGYRVKIVDQAGSVAEVLERPIAPTPVDETIRAAETERRIAALEDQGGGRVMVIGSGGGGMAVDQERMREMMRRQVESMDFAEVVPVISSLSVDGSGRLWVQRYDPTGDDEGPIDLLGLGGIYHGTIPDGEFAVPDAFGPGGLAAYIQADALGVQTVRVIRVTPSD